MQIAPDLVLLKGMWRWICLTLTVVIGLAGKFSFGGGIRRGESGLRGATRARTRAAARSIRRAPICREALRQDNLDYDKYREIEFRHDKALWAAEDLPFRVEFFHPGYLYQEPVHINEFTADARPADPVRAGLFQLPARCTSRTRFPANTGYAGFRLLYQLNEPNKWDELGAFLGASYFRLLGKGQRYGSFGARPGAGLRRDGPPGGISHLHRLVAGQTAAGRQST